MTVGTMPEQREPVYTVEEIAHLLKTSPLTVRRWIYARKLASFKVGQQHRITQSALDEFIRRSSKTKKGE